MSQSQTVVISKFEEVLDEKFSSMRDLEFTLSERFQGLLEDEDDAQVAFNDLNDEADGLLGQYFCYTLTEEGEVWHVGIGDSFDEKKLGEYLDIFRDYYKETFESIDDLLSKLEHRVHKDMSNAGCDAKSALRMILEEDLALEDVFRIDGADAEPRIEYINN